MKFFFFFFFFFIFCLFFSASGAHANRLPDEQNSVDVYQHCNPAVVNITATTLRRDFFMDIQPQKGLGSGVIIDPAGYIVTNDHVIGQAQDVEVTLWDKSQYPAKVVGKDPDSDLAVIKIDAKGKKLTTLEYGKGESLAVGQKTLAIGNPFGLGGTLTVGVISSLGRDIRASEQSPVIKDIIQTDAAINPGNSGGPLLDSSGKLIGINAQIYSTSGGSVGIGFAISVTNIKKVVPQIIQFGQVLRPWLGLEAVGMSQVLLSNLGIPVNNGVMVIDIYDGSPAAKAGLRPATKELAYGFRVIPYGGDVIYKIDSQGIETYRDILDYLSDKKNGDTITIFYARGKQKKEAKIKLSLSPKARGKSL
jgi:S1-C subfamily serine protease